MKSAAEGKRRKKLDTYERGRDFERGIERNGGNRVGECARR